MKFSQIAYYSHNLELNRYKVEKNKKSGSARHFLHPKNLKVQSTEIHHQYF